MINTFADEYDYMIHLAACAVRGISPAELPDGLSFSGVYRRAMEHDIAGLTFYSVEKLQKKPEEKLYNKWSDRRGLALARDIAQAAAADGLRAMFAENGVPFRELQGTCIKTLYPSPDMRTMSDIDLLIPPQSLEKAAEILRGAGYEAHFEEGGKTLTARGEGNINVELHGSYFASDPDLEAALDGVTPGSEAELYAYSLLHTVKHFRAGGCGVRRVLDLYLLDKRYAGLSGGPMIKAVFERAGAAALADTLSRLAQYWFGEGKNDPATAEMQEYIKRSGLHGSFENAARNRLSAYGGKTAYLLRRAFPPRRDLAARYPQIVKHPALYPAFAIHRALSGRKKAAAELRVLIKNKKMKNEE